MSLSIVLGIFIFAIGASVGSFLNVVADRIPAGQSLVSPRSHCPSCNRPLTNIEMVPLLSYLWLKGRCRSCGSTIPARLAMIEVSTGALFAVVYMRFGLELEFLVLCAAVSLLVVVAVIDWEHKLILNRIVFPSIVVILMVAPFWNELGVPRTFLGNSGALGSLLNSLGSGVGAFLLFLGILLAYPQGMGGGDVKLAGLLGLLVGFPGILVVIWVAIVAGGLVAISLIVLRKKGRKDAIAFGPFLSLASILVLLAGNDIVSSYQRFIDQATGF